MFWGFLIGMLLVLGLVAVGLMTEKIIDSVDRPRSKTVHPTVKVSESHTLRGKLRP